MKITEPPIIIEEQFDASAEKLWNAITQIDEMKKWFFKNIDHFKPEVGAKSEFMVKSNGRIFTHLWEITEVVPFKKITLNWKYKEYPGDSFVRFEIVDNKTSTKLKLSTIVTSDFPDYIDEFSRESCMAGWIYFISESLREYLNSSQQKNKG